MPETTWGTFVAAIPGSQTAVADAADVSQATVSRWIAGKTVPSAELVLRIARTFKLSAIEALLAAGYLRPNELENTGVRPRALGLRDFTELELAKEIVRRIEEGVTAFDHPLGGDGTTEPAGLLYFKNPDVVPRADDSGDDELAVSVLTAAELAQREVALAALKDQETQNGNDARPRT